MIQIRQKILSESLKLVPFDGWNQQTMENAAKNAGLEEGYAKIAFPGGVGDLVDYFLRDLDRQMLENLGDIGKKRVRDRIGFAVKTRLQVAEPYKSAIRKTVSYYGTHPIEATKSLWKTVDEIWYAAGDKSADFNHYTKRATLAAVYSGTLLYWLNDRSEGHADTWEFLDRRINNVMAFNKVKERVRNFGTRNIGKVNGK